LIKQGNRTYIILVLPIILLSIFLVYPVVSVIVQGLMSESGTSFFDTLSAYSTQFTISFTFIQASLSTVLALLVGLPGAMLLARLRFRGKSLIRALIIVPFVLPPIVVVVGFLQMFGSYGVIDSALMLLTQSSTSILNLADGLVGIILAHTFYNAPLVMLLVSASMERLNPEIEESAEILAGDPEIDLAIDITDELNQLETEMLLEQGGQMPAVPDDDLAYISEFEAIEEEPEIKTKAKLEDEIDKLRKELEGS